jgi:hypothetical protein
MRDRFWLRRAPEILMDPLFLAGANFRGWKSEKSTLVIEIVLGEGTTVGCV